MAAAPIPVGGRAPEFELRDQNNQAVGLAALREKGPVLIVFFPLAFTGTCEGELGYLRDHLPEFTDGLSTVAVSVGPPPTHKVWSQAQGFLFPILSDFWPHGAVASAYDVFDETKGCPRRSSYIVDKEGVVRWSVHNAMPDGRDLDEHLRQLEALA